MSVLDDILHSVVGQDDVLGAAARGESAAPSFARKALATGARIVTPIAGITAGGALGGPVGAAGGGAIGGALGETIAQQIEAPGQKHKVAPILAEAALGALPFGKVAKGLEEVLPATRLGKTLATAGEAALFGTGATEVQTVAREGRTATPGELATGGAAGAVLGGLLGAVGHKPGRAAVPEKPVAPTEIEAGAKQQNFPFFEPPTKNDIADAIANDVAIRDYVKEGRGIFQVASVHDIGSMLDHIAAMPPEALENTAAAHAYLRFNRQAGEMMDKLQKGGELNLEGVDLPESMLLGRALHEAASYSGTTLQKFQQAQKKLLKLAGVEAQEAWHTGFFELSRNILQARRLLMTQMLGTQIRNVLSATTVGLLQVPSRLITGLMDPSSFYAAEGWIKAFTNPRAAYRMGEQFMNLPTPALEEMRKTLALRGTMAEGEIDSALVRWTRPFNLWIQKYADTVPSSLGLSAFLPESVARRGLDVNAFLRDPHAFVKGLNKAGKAMFDEAAGEAAHNALSVPFRELPQSPMFKELVNLVNKYPLLTLEMPFPRFMVSFTNFIKNYGPWGMLRLFSPDFAASRANRALTFNAANPRFVADAIGKATVGTAMLSAALSLRANPNTAGEKYYELKIPGMENYVDTRPWAPIMAPMLFVADTMLKMSEGKTNIETVDVNDAVSALTGLSRIEGIGSWALHALNAGQKGESQIKAFYSTIGDVLGSFFIPLRTIKDVLNDQRTVDLKANDMLRIFGSTIGNVPLAAEFLDTPTTIKPTTGHPYSERQPVTTVFGVNVPSSLMRQLGVSTIEKDKIEKELNRLDMDVWNIAPRTPLASDSRFRGEAQPLARALDERAAQIMGPTVMSMIGNLMDSPGYREMDDATKAAVLTTYIRDVSRSAKMQAESELFLKNRNAFNVIEAARTRSGVRGLERGRFFERLAMGDELT